MVTDVCAALVDSITCVKATTRHRDASPRLGTRQQNLVLTCTARLSAIGRKFSPPADLFAQAGDVRSIVLHPLPVVSSNPVVLFPRMPSYVAPAEPRFGMRFPKPRSARQNMDRPSSFPVRLSGNAASCAISDAFSARSQYCKALN